MHSDLALLLLGGLLLHEEALEDGVGGHLVDVQEEGGHDVGQDEDDLE